MPSAQQLAKLDQILLVYANGDPLAVEGLKLTYISLQINLPAPTAAQAKIREVDQIRRTLKMFHAVKIGEQFDKINADITELTRLLFPDDHGMACELVKEDYRCETQ
ncbi:MAG: hypothetical protein ALECFALPRED_000419 [Alectoria fallacina]|uniref:Uncharacterized protein n=1 Tax=Alectoria fallacina TaxID=1903189 RepID=A0A8H3IEL6_9LECA|nr:MAG: hypothetical protein ALECFALPRED_000419 [Alectoria fallacina]